MCTEAHDERTPAEAAGVRTTCPYCGVGCGLLAQPDGRGGAAIDWRPRSSGQFRTPLLEGLGARRDAGARWRGCCIRCCGNRTARSRGRIGIRRSIASRSGFADIVDAHGPGAVAFYLSGQLLTEDYYVANKLMKGFIGSANVDTNSRLCMASSVAGHRRAFGADTVPGTYADLDEADLIVLVGSNAAWCHPVLFQRMVRNKAERGARIVVIDPRRTATADDADLFLPIAPGTDTALFCGLLVHLADSGALDANYIDDHTTGFADGARACARDRARSRDDRARDRPADAATSRAFSSCSAPTARVVTCYSQGVNQSAQGTDKVNAIINCHLATGRIGKPGIGPFSLTGQPNAMGGREVGGLANSSPRIWASRRGDRPRAPLLERAAHGGARRPQGRADVRGDRARRDQGAVGDGDQSGGVAAARGAVREALGKLDLFVVSENVLSNDTVNAGCACAAARGRLGREGRHRHQFRAPHFAPARVPAVAGRGQAGLADRVARSPGAWVSPMRSPTARRPMCSASTPRCRASRMTARAISTSAGSRRSPTQDSRRSRRCNGHCASAKRQARAPLLRRRRLLHARPQGALRRARAAGAEAADHRRFPLRLNTGRIRDQWHTMTRTGLSPRLARTCRSRLSRCIRTMRRAPASPTAALRASRPRTAPASCKVVVSDGQRPGSLFVPIHWSDADRVIGAGRRSGRAVHRSRSPASPRPRRRRPRSHRSISPLRGFVRTRRPLALPRENLVGARGRRGRLRIPASRPTRAPLSGTTSRTAPSPDASLPSTSSASASSIAPPLSSTAKSTAACRSDRRCRCRNGMRREAFDADGHRTRAAAAVRPRRRHCGPEPVICACFGVGADIHPRGDAARHAASPRSADALRPAPIAARACPNSRGSCAR